MVWAGSDRWRCRLCQFEHNLDYDTTCRSCERERADCEATDADPDPEVDTSDEDDAEI